MSDIIHSYLVSFTYPNSNYGVYMMKGCFNREIPVYHVISDTHDFLYNDLTDMKYEMQIISKNHFKHLTNFSFKDNHT